MAAHSPLPIMPKKTRPNRQFNFSFTLAERDTIDNGQLLERQIAAISGMPFCAYLDTDARPPRDPAWLVFTGANGSNSCCGKMRRKFNA